jgi:hypothetical protein
VYAREARGQVPGRILETKFQTSQTHKPEAKKLHNCWWTSLWITTHGNIMADIYWSWNTKHEIFHFHGALFYFDSLFEIFPHGS